MPRRLFFLLICLLLVLISSSLQASGQPQTFTAPSNLKSAQSEYAISSSPRIGYITIDNDTFLLVYLQPVYIYDKLSFKSKKEEKFYWRTVRDVKRVLPLSKYIRQVVIQTNDTLMKLPDKKSRDAYMRNFEKNIYKENEAEFSKLTLNQGKLLIRLVDRECNASSYELIKAYRGSFRAGFWQLFAKMLGASLKDIYGKSEQDIVIEQIITLVENGDL